MKHIGSFLLLELRKFFIKKNVVIYLVFLAVLLGFLTIEKFSYNSTLEVKTKFQNFEKEKIKFYSLYSQYGGYGIRLFFLPSQMSMITSSNSEFVSKINSAEQLLIYDLIKGKNLFSDKSEGYMNFTGFLFLIGCLYALFYGYNSTKDKEFLQFVSSLVGHKKSFFFTHISRLITLNLLLFMSISISLLWLLIIQGDLLINYHLLVFFIVSSMLLTFFYVAGSIGNTLKKNVFPLICFYFVVIFLIPWSVTKATKIIASNIKSNYVLELEKSKSIFSLENETLKRIGIIPSGDVASKKIKEIVNEFVKNEHGYLNESENLLRNQILETIKLNHFLSSLFPSSFYLSFVNEISSLGYRNFIDFYSYTQKTKIEFFDFFIKKKFYEKSVPGEIESYIQDDENVFVAKSRFPYYFILGFCFCLLYIAILSLISYKRFEIYLFDGSQKNKSQKPKVEKLALSDGKCMACLTSQNHIKSNIFKTFYAQSQTNFFRRTFIYICHYDYFPNAKLKHILDFFFTLLDKPQNYEKFENIIDKQYQNLSYRSKITVLFYIIKIIGCKTIIFNEIERDLTEEELVYLVDNIQSFKNDNSLLYLSRNIYFVSKLVDSDNDFIIPDDFNSLNI
ncbi:MAG: hypothetical protein KAW12_16465 [Candidatus Aminicenantes bacterium]|nr:hypothetical protein [Candidatus Aminicenantes bacterium]